MRVTCVISAAFGAFAMLILWQQRGTRGTLVSVDLKPQLSYDYISQSNAFYQRKLVLSLSVNI
jgi:hypothetical protein